ncbi:MAG: hypothetical protein JWP06_1196 [Candidatus Saccharibacteria bacterium]|nr:hypothetical protein [Candidatus Saccharibacteria bacterium]
MTEALEIEKNSELAVRLSKLAGAIDERIVDSGDIEPEGVLRKDGSFAGIGYSALVGKPGHFGDHVWHQVNVFIPDSEELPRRYLINVGMPMDGPLEWIAGDSTARYQERPTMGKPHMREVETDQLQDVTAVVESGRLLDPGKEKIVQARIDNGGMITLQEKIVPIKAPEGGRLKRLLGRKASGDQPEAIR